LAFIVTLIVTRRRSRKTSLLERLAWLGPTHVGWILATVIVVVTYLAAAAQGLSDPQSAWKPLGLALVGMMALASDRRRWRLTVENAEPASVRHDLLFLWVFKSGSVMYLAGGICQEWAALGRSRLLGGGEFLGTDDWRLIWYWLRGHAGTFVLKTPEDLDARMNRTRAGQASCLETFVCHDRVWKLALDRLLSDSAIVLMNLSGLSDSNRGCMYEIAVLFNRVALSRVIFLIDQENDVDYVKKIMEDVWQKLDVNSINRFGPAPVAWVVQVTTSMAELRSAGTTHPLDRKEEDAASAEAKAAAHSAETRGLVRLLCAALDRSESQVCQANS